MSHGVWIRLSGIGDRCDWLYWGGANFWILLHCPQHLSRYVWYLDQDGDDLAVGHYCSAVGIRPFIQRCWQQHLAGLTGHEMAEYLDQGLVTEEDLNSAGGAS